MIPLSVARIDGTHTRIDMGKMKRLAKGSSELRPGWSSTLTFSKELEAFVELCSAPSDVRGNAEGAAFEVDDSYVLRVYGKSRKEMVD